MSSAAQIDANRLNAQSSTGPKTEEGKRVTSLNALKTALTGQTVLLPLDDTALYQKIGATFIATHQPATFEEELIVQTIIDTEWRLQRIPNLEKNIYACGVMEFSGEVPEQLIEVETYLKYQKELKNLNIQESRLRRTKEKAKSELTALQTARKDKEEAQRKAKQEEQKQAAAEAQAAKAAAAPTVEKQPATHVPAPAIALHEDAKPAVAASDAAPDFSEIGSVFSKSEAA